MSYTESPAPAGVNLRPAQQYITAYGNIGLITAVIDSTLIVAASVAAGIGYHLLATDNVGDLGGFVGIGSNTALLFVLLAKSQSLYRPAALLWTRQFRGIVVTWAAVLLAIISILFLLKLGESYSRGATIGFGVLGLGLLLGSRAVIASRLRNALASGSIPGRRAIIVGDRRELD